MILLHLWHLCISLYIWEDIVLLIVLQNRRLINVEIGIVEIGDIYYPGEGIVLKTNMDSMKLNPADVYQDEVCIFIDRVDYRKPSE